MNRKTSVIIGVFILITGIAIVSGVLIHAFRIEAETERPFVHERRQSAERHYRDTLGRDMERDYPRTPRELMELYATTVLFLHGNFIALDSMFMQVIEFQRLLFTEELQGLMTAEEQFNNLRLNMIELNYEDASIRRAEFDEIVIDYVDGHNALVQARHRFLFNEDLHRLYWLQLGADGRWRINSWALADENWNIVE